MASNFDFLATYWPELARLGAQAEQCVSIDPSACMVQLGIFAEAVSAEVCAIEKLDLPTQATHSDRVRALNYAGLLPGQIDDLFSVLRMAKGDALYMGLDSREQAEELLKFGFHLACWLMLVYGDWEFIAPDFVLPTANAPHASPAPAQAEDKNPMLLLQKAPSQTADSARQELSERSKKVAFEIALHAEEFAGLGRDPIRLDVQILPEVNFALQQNGSALIQSITIENTTDTAIENVELKISSAPAFTQPFKRHIDHLPAHKTVTLSRPDLLLSADFLAGITEECTGVLHLRLKSEEKTLVYDNVETRVLTFDQWHGSGLYPELLASFVTPKHPLVANIITRATEFLEKWTGDGSIDGYQSQNPNRVLRQAAAIFTAIQEKGIACVVSPANFEQAGQRVRLCDDVLLNKLGNCLDLSLLYAACLEAAGLHPLLIATDTHILTGLWLEKKMFPETMQDDFSLITKRLTSGIQEIAVVESTCVTTGADCSFDDARALGEQNLSKGQPDYILDVHRARLSHICPLPQRVHTSSGLTLVPDHTYRKESAPAPAMLDDAIDLDTEIQDQELPKKVQWERKLLDLGMRNTLINLRMTKTQLPILTGSLEALENALADGSDFTILSKPSDLQLEQFSFDALIEPGKSELIRAEFENNRLRSVLSETELSKAMKDLYRTAKTALEENGANTLYLALGMLRWFETKRSTRARYAPIILLPIEMVRKSAAQGYVIRLRDEEPQMNITLLEKLKQDFGILTSGLDPLPCDERGVDIRRVLAIVRKAVMEQPHWDVLETASIGIFSFSQFVMWNDIRNRTEDLLRNKVVRSLMENKLCWRAEPLQMGETVEENHVLLPMPADASQLFAIQTASRGKSFVLHGPPGTGKSQTITSLIANALANGKRVLFVAEKMAALEVVQKRLDSIGLGPFCLELHSNKSKKKDVLDQLRNAMEVTKGQTAGEYEAQARQLAAMREELDSYARQLHRMLPCGCDLYELINEYELYRHGPDITAFDRNFIRSMTRQNLQQQQMTVERLIAAAREVGHPTGHPLHPVSCTQYSQSLRGSLHPIVDAYNRQLAAISPHAARMAEVLGLQQPENFEDMQRFLRIAAAMTCWYDVPAAWAKTNDPQHYFLDLIWLASNAASATAKKQQLLQTFEPSILDLDSAAMLESYTQASEKWFLPRAFGIQGLTRTLRAHAKAHVSKDSVKSHITLLRDYQKDQKIASDLMDIYGQDLGHLYHGEATDWDRFAHLAANARESAEALLSIFGNLDILHRHGGAENLRQAVFGLTEGFAAFVEAKTTFEELLQIQQRSQENWLSGQMALCQDVLAHGQDLKEWITYTAIASEVRALGLDNVVDCYEKGIDHEAVFAAYKKAILQGLIFDALDESNTLNQFSGPVFNKKIQQYQQMDQQWATLSRQEVYCRLASKVPNFTREAAHSSELGILQRCIKSGGRGVSIRRLFDQIPTLLPRLCPCMLMSPISAAQYLDPKGTPFDIVVFDEASQLPTCKAVGVLARGENAVIVGDPKQMPPTSFFATNMVDEDNLEEEDLESILDDCLALNMPQSHLLWHYRSRHESLIAFSNSRFYENKLFTFPSVNDRESKVKLIHVAGVFDRGKTRTNKAEAQAVVAEIQRRAKNPALAKQSIGVVTFNISQQHLIDDLLTEACARDTELEKWVYREDEPLFIKNLENVQGDERDVILFSIAFGPDAQGKVHMNFGPLNREGGWRRLNVAVSRSRQEMVVFSTLRPEQLDLNRTQAEGVAALRAFLEYAQGRSLALEESAVTKQAEGTDGIAMAICKALKQAGYDTDLSVGRSAYRIDIGVVDPADPERYLLGILLDGNAYGAAKTTRDRELAQIGVLNGLGWKILRVWSMDWWDNSEKERNRILQAIQDAQNQAPPPAPEPDAGAEKPPEEPAPVPPEAPPTPQIPPLFTPASIPLTPMTPEEFVETKNRRGIRKKIEAILAAEAPLSQATLTKRLVQSYGITRAGSRIQSHMQTILKKMELRSTLQDGMVFYWTNEQNPDLYFGLRVNGEGEHRREVKDITRQEIANAIYVVLYEQIGMCREDLLRQTATKLGYRMGSQVLSAMELGITCAQEQSGITTGPHGTLVLSGSGTARAEGILQTF